MAQFNLAQAMKAQSALRSAAGEGEELFDEQQLVGMLSDEIRTLRSTGTTDEDISTLLKNNAGLELDADTIRKFYVDTSEYQHGGHGG